ncbi:2-dehydro-3-deoxy-6-phosphogalactonate aldolase [Collimonas fungivorans]|uniref:2-dehydro-3-deoxyphosphogalactonate aldolase n=2 Tax=Collimonas fungivorans TaxID=158899 RepID=G0AF85_COLFT|nr:2-dehydro-3-deoxy-6-phosphogalactonate aldolase [Collimonas fungivorans]AAT42428.1 2-keto-3-deoxy-6-phosphogluconate aldolase [Collimonas fungivorans Ter331]AEK63812.1 2-dehydro-3-deoxyphosphogalactonate aldolase [Collimonas fungivorans Ter331]
MLRNAMKQCGLIAILRGVEPHEVAAIGLKLYEAGFRIIEVPLNSPQPFDSIRSLRNALPADCLVGAGTVLTTDQVAAVKRAGGEIIVMPHSDPEVIAAAKQAGLACAPGVATVTEAFAALAAGADVLKMFPAEQLGPNVVKAWRAVIPREVALLPVGGITPENLATFVSAGASGFGLGSALYKPGLSADQVGQNANRFVAAWCAIQENSNTAETAETPEIKN